MAKRKGTTETIVGVFVLASLALLLLVVIILGSRQNIFEKRYQITGEFISVAGLQTGAEVQLAGINIGFVQDIEFSETDKVLVKMRVSATQYERIRGDSAATIQTMGLMGDRYVEITVGTEAEQPIESGGLIHTAEPFGIGQMLEEARPTLENLENAILNISILTDELADPEGGLGTILEDVKVLTTDARAGKGTVGALLVNDDIYLKANRLLDTTEETMENLREVSVNAKEASEDFPGILMSVDASVTQLEEFAVRATDAADEIAEIAGAGRRVMGDAEAMAANLKSASEDIREATPMLAPLLVSAGEGVDDAKKIVEAARHNWLLRGYFAPPHPGEPIAVSGRDVVMPEALR